MKKRDTFEKGLSDFSPLGENCVTKASRRLCSFSSFPPNSNCVYVERGGRKEKKERKGKKNSLSVLLTEECAKERSTRGCFISLILDTALTAIVSRGNRFVTKK